MSNLAEFSCLQFAQRHIKCAVPCLLPLTSRSSWQYWGQWEVEGEQLAHNAIERYDLWMYFTAGCTLNLYDLKTKF